MRNDTERAPITDDGGHGLGAWPETLPGPVPRLDAKSEGEPRVGAAERLPDLDGIMMCDGLYPFAV
jgi:hypothetical protein